VLGLFAGLSVAFVAGYLLGVKPRVVLAHLGSVSPWALVACIASAYVILGLQALRWYSVMKPVIGLRYGQAYRAQIVGTMFNAILPARGGDLLRVQYLGRRTGKSRVAIFGTEIVDRWLDWWGWIPAFVVMLAFASPPAWMWKVLGVFGGSLSVWALAMVLLTNSGYTPRVGSRFARIYVPLKRGLEAFRAPRTWIIAFGLAPLPWLWETFVLASVAPLFGIHLTLVSAFCVLVAFNLASVISSPGAVGTVEAGGTAALVYFGVDQSRALAFMFIYHFAYLLPAIVGGVFVLVSEGERLFGAAVVEPEVVPEPSTTG
jgi:glycosyltransferase 2 family protein